MTKEWSQGGPNPFPKWIQWASYVLSDGMQTLGLFLILAVFADGIVFAIGTPIHPIAFMLAFFFVGFVQLFMWVIGDDIRKKKTSGKGDSTDG